MSGLVTSSTVVYTVSGPVRAAGDGGLETRLRVLIVFPKPYPVSRWLGPVETCVLSHSLKFDGDSGTLAGVMELPATRGGIRNFTAGIRQHDPQKGW